MVKLACLALLLAASSAHAETLGVMADVGAPDGAHLALVARPLSFLRFEAGGGHNGVAPCVRGGATLSVPLSRIRPVASVGYGHCRDGDANPLARRLMGDPSFESAWLERVGYDFETARVGIELGSARFTFFLHAGMMRLTAKVHGAAAAQAAADPDMTGATISFSGEPVVALTTPSLRLGFIVYFQ